jgi:hypothetical protein
MSHLPVTRPPERILHQQLRFSKVVLVDVMEMRQVDGMTRLLYREERRCRTFKIHEKVFKGWT